ncbi:ATP-binding protein [Brevibacillus sp. B_LB10_24]|uniref:HAMP domain-containing sensor histidine kinase n=1 Tax=Brevibacillus sp. B_LB10_24 TaxID=3380645 RepID=UPI0038B8D31C
MKNLAKRFANLPIKWRLVLSSSCLLFVLFNLFGWIQYGIISKWSYNQEEQRIQKTTSEIYSYITDQGRSLSYEQLHSSSEFLRSMNESDQLIRILDKNSKPILTLTQGVPLDWVSPASVKTPLMQEVWHGEDHLLVMRTPISSPSVAGTVEVIRNLESFDELNSVLWWFTFSAGLLALIVSSFGGYLLAGQIVRPMKAITATMKMIRNTGVTQHVEVFQNGDEISQLAMIFNEMMDKLEKSIQQQKQFIEDASHELRTPIAVIEGQLSLLKRWGKDDPAVLEESLDAALHESKRLKALVVELLELSRTETDRDLPPIETIDASPILNVVVEKFSMLYPDFQIETIFPGEGVHIAVRPNHFEQVMSIFIDNAIKYSTEKKYILVAVAETGQDVTFVVQDVGVGISEEELPYIFDRFYRVDKARSGKAGYGLGLSIASRLVKANHGHIRVTSELGQGTTIFLTFPRTGTINHNAKTESAWNGVMPFPR